MTHTAKEVRELARHTRAAAQSFADGTVRAPEWATLSGIESALTAYADLLERREAGVMDEVVESAAKAIARDVLGFSWDDLPELDISQLDRSDLLDYARAALEAVCPVAAEPVAQAQPREVPDGRMPEPRTWITAHSSTRNAIVGMLRDEAHEREQEDDSVGVFADLSGATLLAAIADALEADTLWAAAPQPGETGNESQTRRRRESAPET